MAIGDDFNLTPNGGDLDMRHVAGATVYSALEVHAWLQKLADDGSVQTSGNELFIISKNPSSLDGPRSAIKPMFLNLLNGVNIDAATAEFINFGSIQQGDDLLTGVKSIGSPLVSNTPIYVVQNGSQLTKFWPDGHIQILVAANSGGVLIDGGNIRVFSRKYGQTYSDFAVSLVAGGEQSAAISTQLTDWTPLTLAAALALTGVSVTTGDVNFDTGDGQGSKLYKGTIALSNGRTVAEAAQYCQAICDQNSVETIGSVEGWQYRTLNAAYTPNASAPFGAVAGGKWFVAQGWLVTGALTADLQNYELVSNDGSRVTNPVVAGIVIGDLTVGARILVGRNDAATDSGFLDTEYTLDGALASGDSTCTINETVKADTPPTGYIRINEIPYQYTAVDVAAKEFTIDGTFGRVHVDGSAAWVPFIDKLVSSVTESSTAYVFNAPFTARLRVRKGSSPALKEFQTTFVAGDSAANGTNAIAQPDE